MDIAQGKQDDACKHKPAVCQQFCPATAMILYMGNDVLDKQSGIHYGEDNEWIRQGQYGYKNKNSKNQQAAKDGGCNFCHTFFPIIAYPQDIKDVYKAKDKYAAPMAMEQYKEVIGSQRKAHGSRQKGPIFFGMAKPAGACGYAEA